VGFLKKGNETLESLGFYYGLNPEDFEDL